MKRIIITALLCGAVCLGVFSGCSQPGETKEVKETKPAAAEKEKKLPVEDADYDELIPSYEFQGTYSNKDYTVKVRCESDEIMKFTVKTKDNDRNGFEWVIQGNFSEQTYRVNYTDAVKYKLYFGKKSGKEYKREKEYENGSGVMQFSGKDGLVWTNSRETLDGSAEFKKIENFEEG